MGRTERQKRTQCELISSGTIVELLPLAIGPQVRGSMWICSYSYIVVQLGRGEYNGGRGEYNGGRGE